MDQGTITKYRGKFRARVSVDGKRVSVGTFPTEADARGTIAEFLRLHATQVAQVPGCLSVVEWGRQYLDARETDGVHRSVHRDRSVWAARIAKSKLGGCTIDTLTTREIRDWVALQIKTPTERGQRPARTTVANALNLLRVALEAAVQAGHIDTNPARDVRLPRIAVEREGWDWMRIAEIKRLFDAPAFVGEQKRIFTVALLTGLRKGELWGLRWQDVDLERGELVVSRSYGGPTKGGRVRRVPLLAPALAALKAQPKRCSLVFPTHDMRMRNKNNSAGWGDLLKSAGVRRVRFHDIRHTAASHLVQGTWARDGLISGPLRLEEVQQWLGHASLAITQRYAHMSEGGLRGRVVQIDAGLALGLDWTQQDSAVAADVAQLAEVTASIWRREPDSNWCMTVLQTVA